MHGFHQNYLRIDLKRAESEQIYLPESVLRQYLGGVGLGAFILTQECPTGVDPLSPDSPILFCFSPLVGTPLTTSAKFAVVAKSPLTHRFNDALSSSHFALAGKRAGMDALVITGACSSPSMLLIDDGEFQIRGAEEYWGLTAEKTAKEVREKYGPRFQTAAIGPAGENQVLYANISHGSRHAGRGGLGAIMGSKNLKAIAVAGSRRTSLAHPDAVNRAARELSARSFGPATEKYRELGTMTNLLTFNRLKALPTRNFRESSFSGAEKLSLESLGPTRRVARASCAACTIGCEHIYQVNGSSVRLEYETAYALGPMCGISDPDITLRAARMCDDYGLDTISTGATIAFAMECAERGLIDAPALRFGNGPGMLEQIESVAHRRGLGHELADGSRRFAEQLGKEAIGIAPHVKGLELPGYEPRVLPTMALGLAVGARGADHNRSGGYEADFSPDAPSRIDARAIAEAAIETEDRSAVMDSLILCKFIRGVFQDFYAESAELVAHVTGWDVDAAELGEVAWRIVTLKKQFNVREGWMPGEDTLPDRILDKSADSGDGTLTTQQLRRLVGEYNLARGWSVDGFPPGPAQ